MKHNLSAGIVYLTISSLLFLTSSYLINILLGRYLGPKEYGNYGVIISLITAVNLIQTSGLPQAISKYISTDKYNNESIYKSGLIIQIVATFCVTILYFLSSSFIASLLNDIKLIPYIQLSALVFPFFGLFTILTGYYNGLRDFRNQSYIHNLYSVSKLIFVFPLAFFFHIYGVIWGFIISPLIAFIIGFHLPKNVVSFSYKKLIYFSLPLIGLAVFSNLLQSIDLFFVKALVENDNAAGYYTASQNISKIPFFIFAAVSTVLLPSISKSVSDNNLQKTKSLINKASRVVFMLCIPLIIIMSSTSDSLIQLIYSAKFLPASESLAILLIGIGFLTIFTVQSNILSGANSPLIPFVISIIGIIVIVSFCLLLIPIYKLNGAAIATLIGCFFTVLLSSLFIYIKFKTLIPLKSFIKTIIASTIIFLFAQIPIINVLLLPLYYIVLFLIYFLLLFLLKEFKKEDINFIQTIFVKKYLKR